MENEFIIQMQPWFGEEEKRAVCEYMDECGFITEFRRTELFEKMLAEYIGAKHCVVVNNGTISLTLGAMAVGVQAGDEVLVPNYTMIASPNSVKMFGAVPVFVDVDPQTLCMDIELARKAITKKTKAIMLVAANGRYPVSGITAFEALAAEHELILIEDAAQALGSRFPDGRQVGTAGLVGSFSFSMPKIISTGQGGAVVTNNDDIAFKLRRLKDFGRAGGGNDIHHSIGYNFKFTELQACIGIEQMKKLPARVERKKDIFRRYQDALHNTSEIQLFAHDLANTTPWFIDLLAVNRDGLVNYLKSHGIGSRVMYPPINRQKAYNQTGDYPISDLVGRNGLWLPSFNQLSNDSIDYVCTIVKKYYKNGK